MKLRQLFENFVISNDEFEDYLNRTTEQLASEIQSGKNARDAIHDLSLQFSKMHNSAYAAYQRMSDALTSRMYVLDLNAQSSEPAMGDEMGGFDDFEGPDMGGDMGGMGGMGDELGGDVEQLNDPMGGGMQMDLPMGDEMPSDNEMDDYNAVMNSPMADEDTIGESKIKEAGKMKGGAKDPCWSGYKMVGTKKKGSKEVPNCVPESKIDEGNTSHRISRLQMMIDDRLKKAKMVKDPITQRHHRMMADQYQEMLDSIKSKHENLKEFLPALGAAGGAIAGAVRAGAAAAGPAIARAASGAGRALTSPLAKDIGNAAVMGAKGLNTGMQKAKSYMDKQTSSNQGIQTRFPSGGAAKESMYEETYEGNDFFEAYGVMWFNEDEKLDEAEYQGRNVPLGKPMRGDVKKFKVYVKDPSTGNVKKVNFGDPDMKIKKSNPERRKSFRARHNCDNPGPRTKARYWSCRKW
jgi:hypothetical protein